MPLLPDGLHALFWAPFVVRGRLDRATGTAQTGAAAHRAPGASLVVWLHGLGLAPTYVGMGVGLATGLAYDWPLPLRLVGVLFFLVGTALVVSSLLVFRSWRLRAELAQGHELCTTGPFARVRHPIYTAMVCLTVGTFLLVPNWVTALGVLTNFAAGDYRARQEEGLLLGAFGERYRAYMSHTRRFLPGVY